MKLKFRIVEMNNGRYKVQSKADGFLGMIFDKWGTECGDKTLEGAQLYVAARTIKRIVE